MPAALILWASITSQVLKPIITALLPAIRFFPRRYGNLKLTHTPAPPLETPASAVSILETYHQPPSEVANGGGATGAWFNERMVRGLARMVQVSPTSTLVDLTLRGVAPGTYRASVREYGNLRDGASSTGPIWSGGQQTSGTSGHARGALGTVEVGPDGRGSAFISLPFQVWEVTGHALVVTQQDEEGGAALKNDADTVAGVIARSAGVWDNDKVVCSCTGKTLWEERKDEVTKGML